MPTLPEIRRKLTASGTLRPVLRFRFWFVPLLLAALLVIGLWAHTTVERSIKSRVTEILRTTRDADVTALQIWLESQQAVAGVLANSVPVREQVEKLNRLAATDPDALSGPAAEAIRRTLSDYLMPIAEAHNFPGYVVTDRSLLHVASNPAIPLVIELSEEHEGLIRSVLEGNKEILLPFRAYAAQIETGRVNQAPGMYTSAPVRDNRGEVIAALSLRIRPEAEFTRILRVARPGATGEAYAFNADGVMVSPSRFDDELRSLGLIPDDPESSALLNLDVRDPGGNMLEGFRPTGSRKDLPLTRMAASALAGETAIDVKGYRDYRGVEVVGAWTWLSDHALGVAIEVDEDEAFAQLHRLRTAIWALFGLLVVSLSAILLITVGISKMGKRYNRAVAAARKLGQYTLERKLGEGGMGEVYIARHAMLRRPTAIKLLRPDRAGGEATARFEREVQLTSRLTHPNTIAVFDYGRTPDGVFYYAMEYLPGISLEDLAKDDGPQSAGRVIHILTQVCGSLDEAHEIGLIHRDIKPANIILCTRGGLPDVAKVLDFGIVKRVGSDDANLTAMDTVPGTPHYLAPEALRDPNSVDRRVDLYALGAVGYFLLTGTPVFDGGSVAEVCAQHLKDQPESPSERLGRPVSEALSRLILQCLAKDPHDRPATAAALADLLAACPEAGSWDRAAAVAWWADHSPESDPDETPTVQRGTATVVIDNAG